MDETTWKRKLTLYSQFWLHYIWLGSRFHFSRRNHQKHRYVSSLFQSENGWYIEWTQKFRYKISTITTFLVFTIFLTNQCFSLIKRGLDRLHFEDIRSSWRAWQCVKVREYDNCANFYSWCCIFSRWDFIKKSETLVRSTFTEHCFKKICLTWSPSNFRIRILRYENGKKWPSIFKR